MPSRGYGNAIRDELEDTTAVLDAFLIMSVNHPIVYKVVHPDADYFAVSEWSEEYTFNGQPAVLTYWHRSLHDMTDAFTTAGFRVATISEPPLSPDTPQDLLRAELGNRTSFLSFIFFVLDAS